MQNKTVASFIFKGWPFFAQSETLRQRASGEFSNFANLEQ